MIARRDWETTLLKTLLILAGSAFRREHWLIWGPAGVSAGQRIVTTKGEGTGCRKCDAVCPMSIRISERAIRPPVSLPQPTLRRCNPLRLFNGERSRPQCCGGSRGPGAWSSGGYLAIL